MTDHRVGHYSRNGFLTSLGYREVAQRTVDHLGVDAVAARLYLDKVGSVSALELERDRHMWPTDQELLEQSERFLNGS